MSPSGFISIYVREEINATCLFWVKVVKEFAPILQKKTCPTKRSCSGEKLPRGFILTEMIESFLLQ